MNDTRFELLGTIQVGSVGALFQCSANQDDTSAHQGVRERQTEISAFESEL